MKIIAVLELSRSDDVPTVVDFARALNLSSVRIDVELEGPEEPKVQRPERVYKRKGRRSTSSRPKKFTASMAVSVAEFDKGRVQPRTADVHQALLDHFGLGNSFRKGDAKQIVMKKLHISSPSSHITRLMEAGGLVPIE